MMKHLLYKLKFLPVVFICLSLYVSGQDKGDNLHHQKVDGETPKAIFTKIEEGFNTGDVEKFAKFFSSQTYASLKDGVSGYYSPNQFFFILQNYFSVYKPINFRFVTSDDKSDNPYAAGYFKYEVKGVRKSSQVYISLKVIGNSWKISHISIN